jgi:hypothetical protein
VDHAQASLLIVIVIVFQVTAGALTVLGRRQPWINNLHVVGGAVVLSTSLVITLWRWRCRIAHYGVRIVALTKPRLKDPAAMYARSQALPVEVGDGWLWDLKKMRAQSHAKTLLDSIDIDIAIVGSLANAV